jgi:hypothetical protein
MFGAGGGAGGAYSGSTADGTGGNGGNGGGIIYVSANNLTVSGNLQSNGGNGTAGSCTTSDYTGGGGGAAGGSIKLVGNNINIGPNTVVTASAGAGNLSGCVNGGSTSVAAGGNGGVGRIAINYGSSMSGSSSPSYEVAQVPTNNYSVLISNEIPTPNALDYRRIAWLSDSTPYGIVEVQTRSGASNNSTDGTWQEWKPATASATVLESTDTHTNWTAADSTITVADGDITRNVNYYEDEDETVVGNTTKLTTTTNPNAYAEARIGATDLSAKDFITMWVYANQSGTTVSMGFGENTSSEHQILVNLDAVNTWQKVYWDISHIPLQERDGVRLLRVGTTTANNTIYFDQYVAQSFLNNSTGTQITSTPNNYLQYRVILASSDPGYKPTLYNIQAEWSDGYKIQQTDNNTVRLYNYTGSTQELRLDATVYGADLAEWYPVTDMTIEAGDLVALTGEMDAQGVPILRKTNSVSDKGLIGAISTKAGNVMGVEAPDRRLLALAGRIPVKVDPDSPEIQAGDYITSSSKAGYGKLAGPGDAVMGKAFEGWYPASERTTILVMVTNSPARSIELTTIKGYGLIANALTDGWDIVNESTGEVVKAAGAYSELIAANITAGSITAKEFATESFTAFQGTVDNLIVKSGLVADNIQTKVISPLPDQTDITIQIGSEATPSGKLAIQNAQGTEVASIDSSGSAKFAEVNTDSLTAESATISGTLEADNIKSKSLDEIQELLAQVQADQSVLTQVVDNRTLTASNSGQLVDLNTTSLYVTDQAAINALSVSRNFTIGSDLVFQSEFEDQHPVADTINSLSVPLQIQSLAMAPVEIMAGKFTIDTSGNVMITGDLKVAGKIETNNLTLKGGQDSKFAKVLEVSDNRGVILASIDATGSAEFANLKAQTITGSDQARGNIEILPTEDTKPVAQTWTNIPAAVLVSPSYNTQAWVTDITQSGFIIRVAKSPESGVEKLYWWAIW